MAELQKDDLVLIDMPNQISPRIAKVTGLPQPHLVRVRPWLPNLHRYSKGETTYHVDWIKETY